MWRVHCNWPTVACGPKLPWRTTHRGTTIFVCQLRHLRGLGDFIKRFLSQWVAPTFLPIFIQAYYALLKEKEKWVRNKRLTEFKTSIITWSEATLRQVKGGQESVTCILKYQESGKCAERVQITDPGQKKVDTIQKKASGMHTAE